MWKSLFGSKKFITFIVGAVLEIVAASGLVSMDEGTKQTFMTTIAALVSSYVIGQGVADMGKEKAKVEKGIK